MKKFLALILSVTLSTGISLPTLGAGIPESTEPDYPIFQNYQTYFEPSPPAVLLNGQSIAFEDATPFVLEGRTMLPFRAVFEALGAEVTFDPSTSTGTASIKGKTLTLKVDDYILLVNDNGTEHQIQMDVPAMIENDRFVIPVRYVADTMGLAIAWDEGYGWNPAVIITDASKYLEELQQKAPNLYRYLNKKIPSAQSYKQNFNGDINFNMSQFQYMDPIDVLVKLNSNMLMSDGSASGEFTLNITSEILSRFIEETPEINIDPQLLQNLKLKYVWDGKVFYVNMEALSQIIPIPYLGEKWIKVDLMEAMYMFAAMTSGVMDQEMMEGYNQYMQTAMDASTGKLGDITMLELIQTLLSSLHNNGTNITQAMASAYDQLFDIYTVAFSDQYFLLSETDEDNYTLTITMDMDALKDVFVNMIRQSVAPYVSDPAELEEYVNESMKALEAMGFSVESLVEVENGMETKSNAKIIFTVDAEKMGVGETGKLDFSMEIYSDVTDVNNVNKDEIIIPSEQDTIDYKDLLSLFGM